MKEISDTEILDVQLNIFEEDMLEDEEYLANLNQIDLSDPIAIVKMINTQLGGTTSFGNFMNVLMQLLVYSSFSVDKESQHL